jgi:hypothetical protein
MQRNEPVEAPAWALRPQCSTRTWRIGRWPTGWAWRRKASEAGAGRASTCSSRHDAHAHARCGRPGFPPRLRNVKFRKDGDHAGPAAATIGHGADDASGGRRGAAHDRSSAPRWCYRRATLTMEADRRRCSQTMPQTRPRAEEQGAPAGLPVYPPLATLISTPFRPLYTARVACRATGRVDPAPYVASGRRLEGGRPCWGGQDPGGLGQPLTGDPSAMAGRPLAALAWLKARLPGPARDRARTKVWPGTEIAVNADFPRLRQAVLTASVPLFASYSVPSLSMAHVT